MDTPKRLRTTSIDKKTLQARRRQHINCDTNEYAIKDKIDLDKAMGRARMRFHSCRGKVTKMLAVSLQKRWGCAIKVANAAGLSLIISTREMFRARAADNTKGQRSIWLELFLLYDHLWSTSLFPVEETSAQTAHPRRKTTPHKAAVRSEAVGSGNPLLKRRLFETVPETVNAQSNAHHSCHFLHLCSMFCLIDHPTTVTNLMLSSTTSMLRTAAIF